MEKTCRRSKMSELGSVWLAQRCRWTNSFLTVAQTLSIRAAQAVLAHVPAHAAAALLGKPLSVLQGSEQARPAIGLAALGVVRTEMPDQRGMGASPLAGRADFPCVVTAVRHGEGGAKRRKARCSILQRLVAPHRSGQAVAPIQSLPQNRG